jgi:hypothetical protein
LLGGIRQLLKKKERALANKANYANKLRVEKIVTRAARNQKTYRDRLRAEVIVARLPVARDALLAVLLRSEPQPPGDGAVFRHLRTLLRTGNYKRSDSLTISSGGRSVARATGLSGLCKGAAIEN